MLSMLYVFIGGGLGSIFRYSISLLLSDIESQFPWATFAANALSCILLGFLLALSLKTGLADNWRLLLMTGFCGGFSTFSTFTGESFILLQEGDYTNAFANILLSVFVCLFCFYLGFRLGR